MCGIAGWAHRGAEEPIVTEALGTMLRTLARRGPDGEGRQCLPGVGLAHRRLAIFDLSAAGAQPMATPDGDLTIVFNGAIYNWRDLRRELEGDGVAFRSATDTEVLLHGYRAWGIVGLLTRIQGMFAFGLWDRPRQTLLLARDRLGVKPLVYAHDRRRGLAFASTAAALHAAGFASEVNAAAFGAMLAHGYVPDQQVLWSGLAKLPPAHWLEFREDAEPVVQRYWDAPEIDDACTIRFEDAVDQTESLLLAAVKRRLDADVPVGCLLSGGVDSSLVAWAASRLHSDVRTFTVATPGAPDDESAIARRTAEALGLRHDILPLAGSDTLDDLVHAFPEPFAATSALGLLRVAATIKPHATVILTGDGGDEAFLGYPEYRHFALAERVGRWAPRAVGTVTGALLRGGVGPLRRPLRLLDYASRGLDAVRDAQRGAWSAEWAHIAGPRLRESGAPSADHGQHGSDHLVRAYITHQNATAFRGEYLPKVDHGTMYHGLEARSPFLDHTLWSEAQRWPSAVRLHRGELKAVLRALVRRHLGDQLAAERKRGFSVPARRWWAASLRDGLEARVASSPLVTERWVDPAGMRTLWQRSIDRGELSLVGWHLLVADAWWRARP